MACARATIPLRLMAITGFISRSNGHILVFKYEREWLERANVQNTSSMTSSVAHRRGWSVLLEVNHVTGQYNT